MFRRYPSLTPHPPLHYGSRAKGGDEELSDKIQNATSNILKKEINIERSRIHEIIHEYFNQITK